MHARIQRKHSLAWDWRGGILLRPVHNVLPFCPHRAPINLVWMVRLKAPSNGRASGRQHCELQLPGLKPTCRRVDPDFTTVQA